MITKFTTGTKSTKKIIWFRVFRVCVPFVLGGRGAAAKTASKALPAKTCFISSEHGFRRCLVAVTLALTVLLGAAWVGARGGAPQNRSGAPRAQPNQNLDNVDVHVLHVQGNVYMLVGA